MAKAAGRNGTGRGKASARRGAGEIVAERIAITHEQWQARHPAAARAERALRKERAVVIDAWKHKANGTAETHAHAGRTCQGALARLHQSGAIDADQLAWAVEIAGVAERIGADVAIKTASLETRIDSPRFGDGGFHERLGAVRREMAYSLWRRALCGHAAVVLDMIVGGTGMTIAAKRHGMHNRRARRLLIDAIDLWPAFYADVCRTVDGAALERAHARIA